MSKSITFNETIKNFDFFDKELFIKSYERNFPLNVTIFIEKNDLNEIIPLYIAAFKLRLKGFIVNINGKNNESVKKFYKTIELAGIPDVEIVQKNSEFIVYSKKPKNRFEIQAKPITTKNSNQIVKEYNKYISKSKNLSLKEIFKSYKKETLVLLKNKTFSRYNSNLSLLFDYDTKKVYSFLVKNQPSNLYSSSNCCKKLNISIACYLTAIKKLLKLKLVIRKGDVFIPLYDKIYLKKLNGSIKKIF